MRGVVSLRNTGLGGAEAEGGAGREPTRREVNKAINNRAEDNKH